MIRRALLILALTTSAACFYREPRVFSNPLRSVPEVTGKTVRDAATELEGQGFLVRLQTQGGPDEQSIEPSRCPGAAVAAQDPPPQEDVLRASTVTITVASCP